MNSKEYCQVNYLPCLMKGFGNLRHQFTNQHTEEEGIKRKRMLALWMCVRLFGCDIVDSLIVKR